MTDINKNAGETDFDKKYKVNADGSYTEYVETGGGSGSSGGLTDAELRATPVPVSFTQPVIPAGDNNIGNVDIVTLPDLNPVLVTPDADLTQKITCGAPGGLTQGPNKTNAGGWIIKPASTNTGSIWYMYHGQTAANKGFPLAVGESMYVPVLNLNSLDFDVTTSGNSIIAAKV